MKNIAFIITKSEIGGAQTWVNEITRVINDDCNVHLITSDHGWLTESTNFKSVKIIPGIRKFFDISALIELIKYLRQNHIEVLVSSSANAGIYGRLAKLGCRYKAIYVSHGWSCLYNGGRLKKVFSGVERVLSYFTDVVWCISKGDEIKATEIIGIPKKKITTIPNSVPRTQQRVYNPGGKKVLFVGRLTHPKRPELLAAVVSRHPDISLDVVGGGDLLDTLSNKYMGFGNINFLGEVKGFNHYHNYDLFCLISDSEGLPMSGLEAHSAGVPMILSNVGGCGELIGANGILVANDEASIEKALLEVFENYNSYFSAAAKSAEKFIIDNYSARYKELILTNDQ